MVNLKSTIFVIALAALTLPLFAGNPDAVVGIYLTQNGDSKVQIFKYESNGKTYYGGKVIWLKRGKDVKDTKNPNPKLRNRPIWGLTLIWGFTYAGDNVWSGGKIYNPRDGKTYSCKLTLMGNKLKVRGYVGFSWLGKTKWWTKIK